MSQTCQYKFRRRCLSYRLLPRRNRKLLLSRYHYRLENDQHRGGRENPRDLKTTRNVPGGQTIDQNHPGGFLLVIDAVLTHKVITYPCQQI